MSQSKIAIIGAGPAGLQAAISLAELGFSVQIFEKQKSIGGHLTGWHVLFPDMLPASQVLETLIQQTLNKNICIETGMEVESLSQINGKWSIKTTSSDNNNFDAVILASGFDLFNASQKEEYGYGLYPAVVTSHELEQIFNGQRDWPFSKSNKSPVVGLVHCVGSRDMKCGNPYCSKVCCVTAVKQAIEIKKLYPGATVYCFYMDMRMFGLGYEELYHEAQVEHNIQFIRGRLSEASPADEGRIQVKAEDTLMGRPVKLTLDMLVLMVGMTPSEVIGNGGDRVELKKPGFGDGFIRVKEDFPGNAQWNKPGLFIAGACKGPATIPEVIRDAKAASLEVYHYISRLK